MRIAVAFASLAAVLAAAGYLHERSARDHPAASGSSASYVSQPGSGQSVSGKGNGSPIERLERSIRMKAGSRKALGRFRLAHGRSVELFTVDTEDAKSCLVEDDPEAGADAGCLEGGLFRERRVAFSVSTQGGPERFDELHVSGVVAPSIRAAELLKSDGTSARVELADSRAFVFESSDSDLAAAVYPVGFRLLGPNGKLVETVSFPAANS